MTRLTTREVWKQVPGFELLYEVSSEGRVRSIARTSATGKYSRRLDGYELQPAFGAKDHYARVVLCRDGKMSTRKVHQLVAEAFIGPRPDGHVTRHLDDVKSNNRATNLCYGTHIQNAADLARNGRQKYGAEQNGAILTTENVVEIRASTESQKALAFKFGVKPCTISNIRAGRKWKHVA